MKISQRHKNIIPKESQLWVRIRYAYVIHPLITILRPVTRLAMMGVFTISFLLSNWRTVYACGWDYETYHAEARSLPCVFDAILGYWPKHSDAYHEHRIAAFDHALAWMPNWTEGLDAKGISLLKLGRLEQAEAVMTRRLQVTPNAYPGHANLGTLYTFTGAYDKALEHIDRAMAMEPEAHFGREKYHRALVVFLQRVQADPNVVHTENFLGVTPSTYQRVHGSKAVYDSLGLQDDAIDALVAMLTVYGADELAEIYFSLGELLAVRGHKRLAYTAYRRARELNHPRKAEAKRIMEALDLALYNEFYADQNGFRPLKSRNQQREEYRGIGEKYTSERRAAKELQREYMTWETKQLTHELPVWTEAGLDKIYAYMHELRHRCKAPRVIDDPLAPLADKDATTTNDEQVVEDDK